ncbi:HAMP domain-containing sensor histidine kinase [Paenibacillus riograndensis]|uniref:histidine kinase n=1 Tax=Paenibacillus riograndensis SBR5 TaxID=1073571 RepID=A0A0E4CWA7_9BACL|nr:HAMP domain-containing sensor histidine kinase [Paenibacillus riograndensis]CQR55064.1 ATPase/histidine kinase/DNA gyrase B/HSP90 domain protein [Paenibacillus riograndensis SBR5]
MRRLIPRIKEKITLPFLFSLMVSIIFLITIVITVILVSLAHYFGLFNEEIAQVGTALPIIILISCIIIGTTISGLASRSMVKTIREFIEATQRLAAGDFSTRLYLKSPPEYRILSENFNRMAEELGSIEILRTDFVNNFSHEFKTPIVSIKGFAEILKYDDLSEEERDEYLDIVIEESARLASLASNVLELSKIETQTILTDKQEVNVGEQIRQCVLLLTTKLEKKHLSLNLGLHDYSLSGNKEMLNQVWLNLLENAVKFTPEQGTVTIEMKRTANSLEMVFSNTGSVIDPETLPRIFDKFYQADTSHATVGNGLGLTIVQRIVNLHGGTVACESGPLQGTVFIVTLPFAA